MPNIAAVLKQEIARVSRKELRREIEPLKRAALAHRSALSTMRKRLETLERQLKASHAKSTGKNEAAKEQEDDGPSLRFRPEGLKKHRERLGLSAAQAGKIMGVSGLSVYKWESGKTRPRAKQLKAIAALRTLSKREAVKRLQEAAGR